MAIKGGKIKTKPAAKILIKIELWFELVTFFWPREVVGATVDAVLMVLEVLIPILEEELRRHRMVTHSPH